MSSPSHPLAAFGAYDVVDYYRDRAQTLKDSGEADTSPEAADRLAALQYLGNLASSAVGHTDVAHAADVMTELETEATRIRDRERANRGTGRKPFERGPLSSTAVRALVLSEINRMPEGLTTALTREAAPAAEATVSREQARAALVAEVVEATRHTAEVNLTSGQGHVRFGQGHERNKTTRGQEDRLYSTARTLSQTRVASQQLAATPVVREVDVIERGRFGRERKTGTRFETTPALHGEPLVDLVYVYTPRGGKLAACLAPVPKSLADRVIVQGQQDHLMGVALMDGIVAAQDRSGTFADRYQEARPPENISLTVADATGATNDPAALANIARGRFATPDMYTLTHVHP